MTHTIPQPTAPAAGQPGAVAPAERARGLLLYAALGLAFGVIITKGEVISWFRIQEMFRFQGIHMYGVFASALAVASPLLWLLERSGARAITGEPIAVPPKTLGSGRRYVLGGLIFGVGWALAGACPGPLFALAGAGVGTILVVLLAALAGTWIYAALRPHLPH